MLFKSLQDFNKPLSMLLKSLQDFNKQGIKKAFLCAAVVLAAHTAKRKAQLLKSKILSGGQRKEDLKLRTKGSNRRFE